MSESISPAAVVSNDVTRIIRELRSERRWADATLNGETLRSLVERQPIFTFEGTGSWEDKRVVPQTAAAAELLTGPRGAQWEGVLRGILSLSQARDGVDRLGGIALSTSKDGFALGRTIMSLTHWRDAPADGERNLSDYFRTSTELIDAIAAPTNAAASNGGMIAMGADVTRSIDRAIGGRTARNRRGQLVGPKEHGTWATKVTSHEVEHSVTAPASRTYNSRLGWLEEATAEVITEWPGYLDDVGRTLQIPTNGRYSRSHKSYSPGVEGLRRLMRLAGVDTRVNREFDRASEILQGGKLTRTPGRLATAILAANDLGEEHYETVRTAIRDAAWTGNAETMDTKLIKGRIAALERYVREHRPA